MNAGSAKGVMFITIEDETGIANLVICCGQAIHRMAVITCALMRPSIGPLPTRCTSASAAFCVASSRRDGSRASISFLSGVPWQ